MRFLWSVLLIFSWFFYVSELVAGDGEGSAPLSQPRTFKGEGLSYQKGLETLERSGSKKKIVTKATGKRIKKKKKEAPSSAKKQAHRSDVHFKEDDGVPEKKEKEEGDLSATPPRSINDVLLALEAERAKLAYMSSLVVVPILRSPAHDGCPSHHRPMPPEPMWLDPAIIKARLTYEEQNNLS
jgi:hypothetical protein